MGTTTPSLLRENIFFLTVGTFTSCVCILLFDNRLYAVSDILLLFIFILISFIIQAFTGTIQSYTTALSALLLYLQSLAINFCFLALLYSFILAFADDLLLAFKFSLLLSLIQTSLYFFIRYKKQFELNKEAQQTINNAIKQQQVKELEVLKQQIDPHFIFNSFNTLAFLIDDNSGKAKEFSNKLANVYRYIIFNSNKNLVSLADETGFAKDYAYLQEIRHADEIRIEFSGLADADTIFIIPVSIQVLIENAIKHNAFSQDNPLTIHVRCEQDLVSVENNLRPKNYGTPSSKIGLSNLRDRYDLILGKELKVVKTLTTFEVILPLFINDTRLPWPAKG